jgi:hypothetical protein
MSVEDVAELEEQEPEVETENRHTHQSPEHDFLDEAIEKHVARVENNSGDLNTVS